MKPRVIALYLPQYHPIPENDEWWGKGFTEWTNVGRAKPLFKGHEQPKIPTDLGYYDLRLPIVREQQAQLAREAGIEGFCYWHYWFGNGKQLLADIFDEVLATGSPDFPFCLGWANHSWYAKNWNSNDTKGKDRLLIEQTYPGEADIRMHYEYAVKAFKDQRYIMNNDKPIFLIFNPIDIPDNFIELWNKWAKEDGLNGVYFIANININDDPSLFFSRGFSAIYYKRLSAPIISLYQNKVRNLAKIILSKFRTMVLNYPQLCIDYKDALNFLVDREQDIKDNVIPGLVPNFDHTPRSGKYGHLFHHSNPELFYKHCCQIFDLTAMKNNKLVFLRSWNEWGEGNYMEPDLKYGKGYIKALKKALDNY